MQTVMMIFTLFFSFAVPIGLLVYWKKRNGLSIFPFVVGGMCFLLFAMGLEQMLHAVCIGMDTPVSRAIQANPWLYVAYGCLAAGIFEETGRYFGFKVLLRNYRERPVSVAYGIGHGGIETIMTLGLTYLLLTLVHFGVGIGDPESNAMLMESVRTSSAGEMGLAMLERISAMMMHISLSILVFAAVNGEKKKYLYPLAIVLHALTNVMAGLYQTGLVTNILLVELVTFACSVCIMIFGRKIYLQIAPGEK